MRIVVVGAGLGGLTLGALAARDGHGVTLIDRNSRPGGVLVPAEKEGFRFQQSPLIMEGLLPGEPGFGLLRELGIRIPVLRTDRSVFLPEVPLSGDEESHEPGWRVRRLKKLFPEERQRLDAFRRCLDDAVELHRLSLLEPTPLNRLRRALIRSRLKPLWAMSAGELAGYFFRDERLRGLFTCVLGDFSMDPSQASGLETLYYSCDTFFDKRIPLQRQGRPSQPGCCGVVGGGWKLAEALAQSVTARGGSLRLETTVEKVLIQNGRAAGVRLCDGTELSADAVVGSGDALDFFEDAVGRDYLDGGFLQALDAFRPVGSAFMVHLGVDYDPMKYLPSPLCGYYGSYDFHQAALDIQQGAFHGGRDVMTISVPSVFAPACAPSGKHCVTLYAPAPDTLQEGSWGELEEKYADELIALAEERLPELSRHICAKLIVTPEDFRALTHTKRSAFCGPVSLLGQPAPGHVTPVKGLYFAGRQSAGLGGASNVMLGAKAAYRTLISREKA